MSCVPRIAPPLVRMLVWMALSWLALGAGRAPAAEPKQPRLDRFGDPLPSGAVRRFGTLRFRHVYLRDLAFTPDGKQLIASGSGSPLVVFDAATGRRLRTVGPSNCSGNFALSPDWKRAALRCSELAVWDLETNRKIRGHRGNRCTEMAFSPDGSRVAAIMEVQGLLMTAPTGLLVMETTGENPPVKWRIENQANVIFSLCDLAYAPNGKHLATRYIEYRSDSGGIRRVASAQVWLLDPATKTRVRTFGSADVPVLAFAFQPGSGQLVTFDKDSILRFWDTNTGKEVRHFAAAREKEEHAFGALRFSADGKRCAVLTNLCKFVTVLDTKDGRVLRRIDKGESHHRVALAFSADGGTVAAARNYGGSCVRVWDAATGVERLADVGHHEAATDLSLSADGHTLLSRSAEGERIHWNLRSGKGEFLRSVERGEIGQFLWSRNYRERILRASRWRLVYKNLDSPIAEIWAPDGTKLMRKVEARSHVSAGVLSPDGIHLALGSWGGENSGLLFWDPEREEKPRQISGSYTTCHCLRFSHEGKWIVAGMTQRNGLGGAVLIWDAATLRLIRKLETSSFVRCLLLTTDDRILIAGIARDKGAVHAWDMESGKEIAALTDLETQGTVGGLALSPDDRFLAIAMNKDRASTVSIWETISWKPIRSFATPAQRNGTIQAVTFSPDNRSLFASYEDSTILEWDVFGRQLNDPPPQVSKTINEGRLNTLWRKLAESPDAAYAAVWEMLDHPAESVPFLIDRIAPIPPLDEKRVRQLLAELDSESFAEREKASRQLQAFGERVKPFVRQALKARSSLEMKRRLERILAAPPRSLTPEQQRQLRAMAVLEWSNRPEAAEHLRRLAVGDPSATLTRMARVALQRQKR